MQITNIGINSSNYSNTFKARMFEIQTLQNLKGVRCACCGSSVIPPSDVAHAFAGLASPLSKVLENGDLNIWQEATPVWHTLVNLAHKYPEDSLDTILQSDDNNYSRLRGRIVTDVTLTYPEYDRYRTSTIAKRAFKAMLYSSRNELDVASKVMDRFVECKQYLQGEPLKAFETLQRYALMYPNKRLSEIVNLPEVYGYHRAKNELYKQEQNKKLDVYFDRIIKIIKNEDPLSVECFKKVSKYARDVMLYDGDINGRKDKVKQLYLKKMELMKCDAVKEQVFKEIDEMPLIRASEDSFFTYACEKKLDDHSIIKNILSPKMASFKYIVRRAESGNNSIYNGLVMCNDCSVSMGKDDYASTLNNNPDMKRYTLEQIKFVADCILSGKIIDESFSRWPVAVVKILEKNTDGRVSSEMTKYCNDVMKYLENKSLENENKIKNLNNQISELYKNKNQYNENPRLFYVEENKLKKEIEELERQNWEREHDLCYLKKIVAGEI